MAGAVTRVRNGFHSRVSIHMSGLVSIVMPAFNAEATIAKSIGSVCAQTIPGWELIVVDDGSQDSTAAVVSAMGAEDKRIRLISQRNSGVASARRAGVNASRGRYVAFLDADDLWLPHKLERQVEFMSETRAPVSFTSYRRLARDGSVGRKIQVPSTVTYRQLLLENVIPNLTAMIDRHMVADLAIPDIGHEDFAMWLSILRPGLVAHGLSEDLARYRVGSESLSGNKLRAALWVWAIYRNQEKMSIPTATLAISGWGVRVLRKWRRF